MHEIDSLRDTIAAVATPAGAGALGIVRVSGPDARRIVGRITRRTAARASHRLGRATIHTAEGRALDDGLVVEMHAPRSYTGEDVAEFHVHGAVAVVEGTLQATLEAGARLARGGEFTLRAFLNGKLDLTQAEAVGDLIAAQSAAEAVLARRQLRGAVSQPIAHALSQLEGVAGIWRAALDFPEDVHWEETWAASAPVVREILDSVETWVAQAEVRGHQGRQVVLCGAPNVGKSTLLNRWAGEERVMVDASPGTTRDPIEVVLQREGVRWSVWDTAGMRQGAQGLEAKGASWALERATTADLAVWLVDASAPKWPPGDLQVLVVGSKADEVLGEFRQRFENTVRSRGLRWWGWVSGQSGEGVEDLAKFLAMDVSGSGDAEGVRVVHQRQLEALEEARGSLAGVLGGVSRQLSEDLLTLELERAMRALGRILGRDVDGDLLNRVFADFCIGK